MSDSGDEFDENLEPYSQEEQVNLVAYVSLSNEFFSLHIRVFHELGAFITFTLFEYEVLMTINVVPSHISPNRQAFIKVFEMIYGRLKVAPIISVFLSFYGTKATTKRGWVTLNAFLRMALFTSTRINSRTRRICS